VDGGFDEFCELVRSCASRSATGLQRGVLHLEFRDPGLVHFPHRIHLALQRANHCDQVRYTQLFHSSMSPPQECELSGQLNAVAAISNLIAGDQINRRRTSYLQPSIPTRCPIADDLQPAPGTLLPICEAPATLAIPDCMPITLVTVISRSACLTEALGHALGIPRAALPTPLCSPAIRDLCGQGDLEVVHAADPCLFGRGRLGGDLNGGM
jgi:hypothetical protein